MDQVGRNSLVLEIMLQLAQELQDVMPATEEDDLSSLKVARCLEVHFNTQRHTNVTACTGPSEDNGAPENGENN
ncbi:unnamed protein product [Lampetra fluviatilis]